jgi:hypothetical protein
MDKFIIMTMTAIMANIVLLIRTPAIQKKIIHMSQVQVFSGPFSRIFALVNLAISRLLVDIFNLRFRIITILVFWWNQRDLNPQRLLARQDISQLILWSLYLLFVLFKKILIVFPPSCNENETSSAL